MALTCEQRWQLATSWTSSNHVLIRCVAAPYYAHMGCSSKDLESEALLIAYQTIALLLQSGRDLSCIGRYFRVSFRTHCIKLTMGVRIVSDVEVHRLPVTMESLEKSSLEPVVIERALGELTRRQQQVARWVLAQPTPVNADEIGRRFGISSRGVRSLISSAISRIENGHKRLRQTVPHFS